MPSEFWVTQPVGRGESIGTIDPKPTIKIVSTTLPKMFSWRTISDIPKITNFLEKFYVEDVSSKYRLSYSNEFFEFLFNHPKHREEYSLGLLCNNELVGYILAREHDLVLRTDHYPAVSINFLCIDKEFRNQNLAPLMIKEITRISHLNGIFRAVFTAEKDYGFSICKARYYHYPMNGENLLKGAIIDDIDEALVIPVLRIGTAPLDDPSKIFYLYEKMCKNFIIHEQMNQDAFNQVFKGQNDAFITIYNQEAEEFASFFIINTKCIDSNVILKRAYLYYWAGSSAIINDAISYAYSIGVDMFDILNTAQNDSLIRGLGLLEGSGTLKYHLFNVKEEVMSASDVNFILF